MLGLGFSAAHIKADIPSLPTSLIFAPFCKISFRTSSSVLLNAAFISTVIPSLVLALNVHMGLMCFITMAALVLNDFAVIALGQFSDCYGKCICSDKIN